MNVSSPTIQLPSPPFIGISQASQKPHPKDNVISKKRKRSVGVVLSSAAIAGAIEATATYPFEFAKTRVQLHTAPSGRRNPFSVIANVARTEGLRSIYVGSSCLIFGTAFKAGVRLFAFDRLRNQLADENGALSPTRALLAAVLAGTAESVIAVTPTERIKTALIEDAKNTTKLYRTEFQAFRLVLRNHGISGLYHGLVSTTLKQASTSAVKMSCYNVLKEVARRNGLQESSTLTFGMGALAGTVTVYVTQPFDMIKTRAQSAYGASHREACRSILSDSGLRGFWSGSTSRLGRLVFSTGIVYTVYEKVADTLTPGIRTYENDGDT
ncbi:CtIP- endonuclease [Kalmusia sp. IMI 367209]|nr:CtIP- endonuclease [Kalmusia sp. IMI 367209]